MLNNLIHLFQLIVVGIIGTLFFYGATNYPGNIGYYFLFSFLSFLMIICGFSRKSIFFDTFIALFFFLGFWLKFTLGLLLLNGDWGVYAGEFNSSPAAYDEVLLVASLGFGGLLLARIIRQQFFFSYETNAPSKLDALLDIYNRYRQGVLILFVLTVLVIGTVNIYLGIYQRGMVSQTNLPYGMNGVFKWLLLFGLASFSALLLRFEYHNKKQNNSYLVAFLAIFETFLSNLSLLSRGMVLNGGALIYGYYKSANKLKYQLTFRFMIPMLLIFILLFVASVVGVNFIRAHLYNNSIMTENKVALQAAKNATKRLFLERWVGIDGVMAVSSYKEKQWGLWKSAWHENFNPQINSFYDETFIKSPYKNMKNKQQHFISLPGLIAFCYYPGSFVFVLIALFMAGLIGAFFEWLCFSLLGTELIFCALVGEVVAYRFMSFGYVPSQSYLLFGALIMNILLIFFFNKFFSRVNNYKK